MGKLQKAALWVVLNDYNAFQLLSMSERSPLLVVGLEQYWLYLNITDCI